LVELITVSAMHQQFAGGARMGAYPDSISQFEQRNPVYINPEDILVNVLALKGHDPDIKTRRIKSDHGETVISSGAEISNVEATPAGVRWRLHFFPGELSHSLIVGRSREACWLTAKRWSYQRVPAAARLAGGGTKRTSDSIWMRLTSPGPCRLKSFGNEECERAASKGSLWLS